MKRILQEVKRTIVFEYFGDSGGFVQPTSVEQLESCRRVLLTFLHSMLDILSIMVMSYRRLQKPKLTELETSTTLELMFALVDLEQLRAHMVLNRLGVLKKEIEDFFGEVSNSLPRLEEYRYAVLYSLLP